MPNSNTGAWRAFSLGKQVDIATAKTTSLTSFYYEGDPNEPEINTFKSNDNEVNGELLPTVARALNRKFNGKHKSVAYPHLIGLIASMCMGKDTAAVVGATTAYSHKIEIDKTMRELPYRTMIENDGMAQFLYAGVACSGFTLSGERDNYVQLEADFIGRGSEASDATSKPARVAESYLSYGDIGIAKGGTFNGTAVTGGTSLAGQLQKFKLSVKNNAKGTYLCGDQTGYVGRILRGENYAIELEVEFDLEDQSHRTDLLNGTEFVVELPIVGATANGTAKYTADLILPRLMYREVKKSVQDGFLKVAAKYHALADPTYGGLIINVINLQSASYLA